MTAKTECWITANVFASCAAEVTGEPHSTGEPAHVLHHRAYCAAHCPACHPVSATRSAEWLAQLGAQDNIKEELAEMEEFHASRPMAYKEIKGTTE